ncbi:MAG: hypothetical protein ACJAZP_003938 [Psychromonas sp.]|jgi:hypothetical protein|uniref:hypothetical protein n=1 Tax=Psychromonas sp. TaxID=1884585 RepID=UPI0039E6A56C
MKNKLYQTIKIIEKHKEYSLLSSVASARQSVEQINSSIESINNILNTPVNKAQLHNSIISQNSNNYKKLISHVSSNLQKEYTNQNNELSRREFHLNRQAARSKLVELFIDNKQRALRKKKAERDQSRLADLISITRKKSIFT